MEQDTAPGTLSKNVLREAYTQGPKFAGNHFQPDQWVDFILSIG